MKNIFFIITLMFFSTSAFSQTIQPDIKKIPARYLVIHNYTKCDQYFLVAGVMDCENGCYQNQENYLTNNFYVVKAINPDGSLNVLELDAWDNLFQGYNGAKVEEAYISHVKIPHDSPPKCNPAQIIGENMCLTASTQIYYEGMIHCNIKCYQILATWKPAMKCEETAYLTFTEY